MPNSLTSVIPDRPWLSPPGHLCWIWVRTSPSPFHGLWVDSAFAISPFNRFVPLRLPRPWTVGPGECPARATPKRRLLMGGGAGILTRFPFVSFVLRRDLGPANPRLMNIAEEPLPLWPSGFLPDFRCYYNQDFQYRTVHTSSHPCFHPNGTPAYSIALLRARLGIGGELEPRSFSAPRTSAGKLLRFS